LGHEQANSSRELYQENPLHKKKREVWTVGGKAFFLHATTPLLPFEKLLEKRGF